MTSRVGLVHNGIIENFRELREELEREGVVFETETDTEVVVHLLDREVKGGAEPVSAVATVLKRLKGAFALAILFAGHENLLIGARRGSPLALGYGRGEMFLGSDAMALAPFTDRVSFLEEGDWVVLSHSGAVIHDETGSEVSRPITKTLVSALLIDKGNHRHFMAKEIHEQPEVISRTLAHYVRFAENAIALPAPGLRFDNLSRLTISACGTAFYAALTAKYWFERLAKLPVEVDIASEFRYREAPLPKDGLAVFVSQSGETADTLASLRYCKEHGQTVASIVNVREFEYRSRIPRCSADLGWPGNRGCLDKSLHLSAHGSGLHGDCGGAREGYSFGSRRGRAGTGACRDTQAYYRCPSS